MDVQVECATANNVFFSGAASMNEINTPQFVTGSKATVHNNRL